MFSILDIGVKKQEGHQRTRLYLEAMDLFYENITGDRDVYYFKVMWLTRGSCNANPTKTLSAVISLSL